MNDTPQDSEFGDTLPPDPLETLRPDVTRIPPAGGGRDGGPSDLTLSNWAVSVHHEGNTPIEGESELDLGGDEPPAGRPEYELRRVIGRGGFGEVYEAVQLSLKRVVALKRLRADKLGTHADDPASWTANVRMFREEAFISAQLDHPNILPVHDLGRDDSGLPVMAMKLVRGKPWDDLIRSDFDAMPEEEFLSKHIPVLIDVAHAVAFAHSRGIIHRDLKPAQVMVGAFGEVLLMDWGLALKFDSVRLEQLSGSEVIAEIPTTATASNPAGTPAYMAPEQTEATSANVGPWTDIYLLGGILYVLLTGRAPRVGSSSLNAMRQAQDGEYTPVEEGAPAGRHLPEGLAALCTQALNPSRFERVPSAEAFVAALQDHLSGAQERAESMALAQAMAGRLDQAKGDYRVFSECITGLTRALNLWPRNAEAAALRERTFEAYARGAISHGDLMLAQMQAEQLGDAQKRSGLLAEISRAQDVLLQREKSRRFAFVAVGALLVVIAVGSTVFALRLKERTAIAEAATAAAEVSEGKAVDARRTAEKALSSAEVARNDAEDLIAFMLGDLRNKLEPVGRIDVLDAASGKVVDYFEGLPDGNRTAESLLRQTYAYDQNSTVSFRTGKMTEAKDLAEKGLATALRIEKEFPGAKEGDLGVVDAQYTVGISALGRGDIASASVALQAAYDRAKMLLESGDRDERIILAGATSLDGLSSVAMSKGDYASAVISKTEEIKLREEIVGLRPGDSLATQQLSGAMLGLVTALDGQGRTEEALNVAREALVIDEKNYNESPESMDLQERFAFSLFFIARLEARRGNPAAAVEPGTRALKLRRERFELDPANTVRCVELAQTIGMMVSITEGLGKKEEAMALILERGGIIKGLIDLDPANDQFQRQYFEWHVTTGDALVARGKLPEALKMYQEGAAISQAQFERTQAKYWRDVISLALLRAAKLQARMGQSDEAIATGQTVLSGAQKTADENPADLSALDALGNAHNQLTALLLLAGRPADGLVHNGKFVEIVDQLVAAEPNNPNYLRNQAYSDVNGGDVQMALGDAKLAASRYANGMVTIESLLSLEPTSIRYKSDAGLATARLGEAQISAKDFKSASAAFTQAQGLWKDVLAANPASNDARAGIAAALVNLARIDRVEGNAERADERTSEALGLVTGERDLSQMSNVRLLMAQAALIAGDSAVSRGEADAAKATWEQALASLGAEFTGAEKNSASALSISLLIRLDRGGDIRPLVEALKRTGGLKSAHPDIVDALELARSKGLLAE
jgi:serine/threonine protein kinase/tetratricopeptide (TPR) repeat protein